MNAIFFGSFASFETNMVESKYGKIVRKIHCYGCNGQFLEKVIINHSWNFIKE